MSRAFVMPARATGGGKGEDATGAADAVGAADAAGAAVSTGAITAVEMLVGGGGTDGEGRDSPGGPGEGVGPVHPAARGAKATHEITSGAATRHRPARESLAGGRGDTRGR